MAEPMDYRAVAEGVWRQELAAQTYTLSGDVAAARAATAPDAIHLTVDGRVAGPEVYLNMVAGATCARHLSITAGPGEALVLSPAAVLVAYPVAATLLVNGAETLLHERAAVLWMKRDDVWQTVFIHATPLAAPASCFGDANGRLVDVCVFDGDGVFLDETTIAARKAAALACEQAAVDSLRRHDIETAMLSTHLNCVFNEANGSRHGRNTWLRLVRNRQRVLHTADFDLIDVVAIAPHAMLVVYTMTSDGDDAGAPFWLNEAVSALWVWCAGAWQCVFRQVTVTSSRGVAA